MRDHRVILVTGATSGIGKAVATLAAERGMRVVLNSARSPDAGTELAASLPGAHYVQADVGDPAQVRTLVERVEQECGRLDVLVNNAGVTRRIAHRAVDEVSYDVWREILDVNLIGTWSTTQASVDMLRRARGVVVNVSSVAGGRPVGSSIPYAVSKAAVNHMTRLLAAALGPEIRVNAVAPGLIDTPWTADFGDIREHAESVTPLRRIGTPQEVAESVLWLAGTSYTTGEVLGVDGGAHLV
ncbi:MULTISPECIES: SDR family NAD(P)-dependent oxidoreductase [Streptomyces]|uniref:3-oxoacyl-[acyl-carrier-protein] reductase FabG n=1 Tax=Streptomyces chartreusis NRRL 3882 TaxID=1079985 RepID=A0A2N9B3C0_STRCX|nr:MULTISPECIES: SDR family oxidoreductase [Streptomyces]MYS89694.1 SDR family oxidoreductase [Streptomyces sp. SID5464]SOR77819.1 3-oxoacyl-[acyl-carrier-protein] reductase FabG [Streptomyces chartreusis NRRL 3882]